VAKKFRQLTFYLYVSRTFPLLFP